MKHLLTDISKKICIYTIITTIVISFLLWIAQLLRYINFMTNVNLAAGDAFSISLWLIPESINVAITLAFAIAVGIVYTRLRSTNQILSMFVVGANYELVLSPIISAGIFITGILYVNSFYIAPICMHKFYSFKQEFNNSFILPASNSVLNYQNVSFFIGKKDNNNTAYNVIVHDKRNKNRLSTLTADQANVMVKSDKIAVLLKNGEQLTVKDENLSKITFNEYETFIPKKSLHSAKQYNEKMLHELLISTLNKDQAMLHQKIISPLNMLICGIIVGLMIILIDYTRTMHFIGYMYSILAVIFLQSVSVFILKVATSTPISNVLFYGFYVALFLNLRRYIKSL